MTPHARFNDSWTVSLNGTVSDPNLTGSIAGTGVLTREVYVGLKGADGRLLSDGVQRATVSGGNWSINFGINGEKPNGTYTVTVQAIDGAQNRSAVLNVGTIRLDTIAPGVAVASSQPKSLTNATRNLATVAVTGRNERNSDRSSAEIFCLVDNAHEM